MQTGKRTEINNRDSRIRFQIVDKKVPRSDDILDNMFGNLNFPQKSSSKKVYPANNEQR